MKYALVVLTSFCVLTSFSLVVGCKKPPKPKDCYDHALYLKYKDAMCPTHCPGVTGCDGKIYCNECEAARNGIRVK